MDSRFIIDIFDREILSEIDEANSKILSEIDELPFAAFVGFIINTLHIEILSEINKFNIEVGFIIHDLNLAIQVLLIAYAIYRFSFDKATNQKQYAYDDVSHRLKNIL